MALGNEPVRVGGDIVGRVTSAGYGYAVERSIAYAYLPPEVDVGAAVELDIFGEWVGGRGRRRAAVRPRGHAPAARMTNSGADDACAHLSPV